jgi:hypothetical protein
MRSAVAGFPRARTRISPMPAIDATSPAIEYAIGSETALKLFGIVDVVAAMAIVAITAPT